MTDLDALLSDRETLANRLETIEAALLELRSDVARLNDEIEAAKRQRQEAGQRGRRMYTLLQEVKRELLRHDTLIRQYVEEIAARNIGPKEGAFVMNGFVIARIDVGGVLITALVDRVVVDEIDSS